MTLQFYLGRAGSGKTRRCLQEITERLRADPTPHRPPLVWLLPEQATAQAERALLDFSRLRGFARAHVVSFRRLAQLVLAETGGAARAALSEEGRLMLLRAVVTRHRDQLALFGRSSRESGFVARLAATFRELARFRHSFDDLEARARRLIAEGKGETVLALKLHDLVLLGRAWEKEIAARFADADHFLDELAARVGRARLFERAEVWVDGFASFMPQERRVIEGIMRCAAAVRVALLLDPAEARMDAVAAASEAPVPVLLGDPMRLFGETEETYLRLRTLAAEAGVEILDPIVLPENGQPTRFSGAPGLAMIEANLAGSALIGLGAAAAGPDRSPGQRRADHSQRGAPVDAPQGAPCPLPGAPPSLPDGLPSPLPSAVCVEAAGRREEVEAVARAIRRLCRDEGERYRDVAVITRDLEPYHALIRSAFAAHGVPYFLDRRRTVSHHPLVELLRSAARVARDGWTAADVLHYLKTDLAPVERTEADEIENYALAHGVRERRWWTERSWATDQGEAGGADPSVGRLTAESSGSSLDAIRARAFAPLIALEDALSRAAQSRGPAAQPLLTAARFAHALIDLLGSLDCARTIERWAAQAREEGNLDLADEHRQVWDSVTELIAQMAQALGDEPMPLRDLVEVLETGLAGLTLALAPPALDQVIVGAVDRSRQPNLRTVFVLGMNEGLFPAPASEDPMLSDADRRVLSEGDFELAPSAVARLLRERYLAYVAFTRPSTRLWVSWAAADDAGKALRPSPFVRILEESAAACAPPLVRVRIGEDWLYGAVEAVERPGQAIEGVVRTNAPGHRGPAAGSTAFVSGAVADESARGCETAAWRALGRRLAGDPKTQRRLNDALRSLSAANRPRLDRTFAQPALDVRAPVSVSRLETFAECPFRYFAQYVLRLREREEFRIEPLEIGEFHHRVLREVFEILARRHGLPRPDYAPRELGEGVLDWGRVDVAQALDALDEALRIHRADFLADGPLKEFQSGFFVGRSRRTLAAALRGFVDQGAQDAFVQAAAELAFGFPDSTVPPLRIPLRGGGEIALHGKIDRVDVAPDPDGRPAVRVIDFKSSDNRLNLADVLYGLSLQLPIYLAALRRTGSGVSMRLAGAFFVPIASILREVDAPDGGPSFPCGTAAPGCDSSSVADALLPYNPIRARGVLDRDAIALFGPLAPGERSAYVAVTLTKDGAPGYLDRDDWLPPGVLERLSRRACAEAARLAEGILACRIDVRPYRQGNARPCRYCPFGDVCRIAPQHADYRVIPPLKKSEILPMLEQNADSPVEHA